jgi:hypothetical protein
MAEPQDPATPPAAPLVSVYMLAYRHEPYIAQAIESIVAQQVDFPFELVVGEDCSPDRTREIALRYQASHPRIVRVLPEEANVGAFDNSARCIRQCRGEFIAICEGDDYFNDPRKLQAQVDALRADPGAIACHTDFNRQIGSRIRRGVHARQPSPHLEQGDAYVALLHAMSVKTPTVMYRREALTGFLDSHYNRRDWPFGDYSKALYASGLGRFIYLPQPTATWRKVYGSATNSGFAAKLRMGLAMAECREQFMRDRPVDEATMRSVRRVRHMRVLDDAFYADRADLMRESIDWLDANGFAYPRLGVRLKLFALRARWPLALARAFKRLVLIPAAA